jgi:hypothetical protein
MGTFPKLQAIRAVKAGGQADGLLHAGDIVTHINGTDVQHMNMADIVGLIATAELLVLVVGRKWSDPLEQQVPLSLSGTGDGPTTTTCSNCAGSGSSLGSSHAAGALCVPAGGWNPSTCFGFSPDAGESFCPRRNDCA